MYWNLVVFGLLLAAMERLADKKVSRFRIPLSILPFAGLIAMLPYLAEAMAAIGALKAMGVIALTAIGPFLIVIGAIYAIILAADLLARLSMWRFRLGIWFSMWHFRLGMQRRLWTIDRSRRQLQAALSECEEPQLRDRLVSLDNGLGTLANTVRTRIDNDAWRR